ncbi:hypothetical protein E3J62_04230, partial [candidate division TA06 bacterium]
MNRILMLVVPGILLSAAAVFAQAPKVTHIYPGAGISKQSITTRVYGDNFQIPLVSSVKLIRSGYPDIEADSIDVTSQVCLTCNFDLLGSSTGLYGVVVRNASGSDSLHGCFTVYSASDSPYVWVKTTVGSGSDWMYSLTVGDGNNDGEIEVYGANWGSTIYQFKWDGM